MEEETKLLDLDGLTYYHEQLQDEIEDLLADKQDTLVSGTSIKTINNQSILGSGNVSITENVQPDWNESSSSADDYIKNKPTKLSEFSNDSGFTTNTGTITGVKMNGSTVASSGEADLGTVITAHQNIKTINSTSMVGTGDVSVQPTLVSGTNIKTINNESLLGSGNITIQGGGGDTTYEINVSSYPDFSTTGFNGLDTTANRTVYKAIYDNFDNIDVKNVFIIADDAFSDGIKKINVKEIEKRTSGDYVNLSIYTNWYDIGSNTYYGTDYNHEKQHCIFVKFSSDEIYSITDYVTIRDTFNVQNTSGAGLFLGLNNTTSYTPSGDYNPATKKYVDDNISQKSSMPAANSSNLGKIIQYKGTTTSSYTNGYFYKCVNNGGTYSWTNINVQDGGSGGSTDVQINGTSIVSSDVANIITEGTYNASTNKIATMSDVNALITASTTDISEGDPLDSGTLYIVYE